MLYMYLLYIYIYIYIIYIIIIYICTEISSFNQEYQWIIYTAIEADIPLTSENPVEELQTKGENVKVKENEKSATEINGYHKISLI